MLPMKSNSIFIIIIQSITIVCLVWVVIMIGGNKLSTDSTDDYDDNFIDYTKVENGLLLIELPKAVAINSNIKYEVLRKTSFVDSTIFYGESINIKPLINLNTKLLNVRNKIDQLSIQITAAEEYLEKLTILNDDNKNISDNVLGQQQIDVISLKNQSESLKDDKANIMATIHNEWGGTFAEIFSKRKDIKLKSIISGKNKLVKITFSTDKINLEAPMVVKISSLAQTNYDYEALYFSSTPEINVNRSGMSFYYLVNDNRMLNEEKFTGHRSANTDNRQLLFIPKKSVIWSNGIPWAYTHINNTKKYIKKSLSGLKEINNGWVIEEGNFIAGDLIVTEGAQLLLSEEFKYQIKNENED